MKIFNIDFTFKRALLSEYAQIVILFATALVLVLLIILLSNSIVSVRNEYVFQEEQLNNTLDRIARVDSSKEIPEEQIDRYNKILSELIPKNDTNLDLYSSLELLSTNTGFVLYNYRINQRENIQGTESLKVIGEGNEDDLNAFLDTYKWASGRLITLSEFSLESGETELAEMDLNLYTSRESNTQAELDRITQRDIQFLNSVVSEVSSLEIRESPTPTPQPSPTIQEQNPEATESADLNDEDVTPSPILPPDQDETSSPSADPILIP